MCLDKTFPLGHFMLHYHPQRSWGKVIFSQLSVILSTGGLLPGGACSRGWLLPGVPGPGDAWSGGCLVGRCLVWGVLVMSMWDEILTDRSFLDTYHITHLCSVKWRFFKKNIIKILNQKVKYLPVNSNNPNIFPTLGIKHFRHGCTSDKGIFTN